MPLLDLSSSDESEIASTDNFQMIMERSFASDTKILKRCKQFTQQTQRKIDYEDEALKNCE